MCTVTMQEILEICGANVPGNTALYVTNYDDIASIPAATDKVITGDIVMVTGSPAPVFLRFNFTEDTCQHTEQQNDAGSVDGLIQCRFDKDDAVKRNQFENMANGKFTVIITDGNELTKIVRKCRWKRNFDSGTSGADVNGYDGQFVYTSKSADIYEGTIPV